MAVIRLNMSITGPVLTLWSVRIAGALYVVAMVAWLARKERMCQVTWTVACAFYLAHVAAAFHFYHGWSHAAAYRETERRTAEVFGVLWGGGLYFNYTFTAIWIADVLWWWRSLETYRNRPRWIALVIQAFFALMFFNATVIFAAGRTRWLGLAATALVATVWMRTRSATGSGV